MPTNEYATKWYPKYGVKQYHDDNVYGQNVSVYIIDTGSQSLPSVRTRSVAGLATGKPSHASFVTSILAQPADSGVSGIAPQAQFYATDVSTYNSQGIIYTSHLVSAIEDAVRNLNVDIITISLGTTTYDRALEDAVNEAASKGILVFAASGNCKCRMYEYPAACEQAISVASLADDGSMSAFNTRNDSVALFAPGQNISVPAAKGTARLSGTSFAAPFASGLAALVLSKLRRESPGIRISRAAMVAMLRNEAHLGLSCSRHNYSQSPCSLSAGALAVAAKPGTIQVPTWLIGIMALSVIAVAARGIIANKCCT